MASTLGVPGVAFVSDLTPDPSLGEIADRDFLQGGMPLSSASQDGARF